MQEMNNTCIANATKQWRRFLHGTVRLIKNYGFLNQETLRGCNGAPIFNLKKKTRKDHLKKIKMQSQNAKDCSFATFSVHNGNWNGKIIFSIYQFPFLSWLFLCVVEILHFYVKMQREEQRGRQERLARQGKENYFLFPKLPF